MELEFTRKAREDLLYLEFYNPKLLEKARAILYDIENHPTGNRETRTIETRFDRQMVAKD